MQSTYQFVARLDADGNAIKIYSTLPALNQTPPPGCVVYNDNPTGGHARLPDGSIDLEADGVYLWRWDGSALVRKTGAEIEAEREEIRLVRVRAAKRSEIAAACKAAIYAGVEFDGKRYALTEEDQINISTAYGAVKDGAESFLYHADGDLCEHLLAAQIRALADAATRHKIYHTTYCNHLNAWIRRAAPDELDAIFYGSDLPPDLAAHMAALLGQ